MGYDVKTYIGPQIQIFEIINDWDSFHDLLGDAGLRSVFNEGDGCIYCFEASAGPLEADAVAEMVPSKIEAELSAFKIKHSCTAGKIANLLRKQPDEMSVSYDDGGRAPPEDCIDIIYAVTVINDY
jgi:hypothetical protein